MGDERLFNELERLRRAVGPSLCAERSCRVVAWTERLLLPDGTEEVRGHPPAPLCEACPERDNPEAPPRHVQIVKDYRGRYLDPHRHGP